MLRGYIEQVTPELISGWLYSEAAPLGGRVVLAMLDGNCIASGRIQHFRQDLLDAGLGDGVLGFHFALPGVAPEDLKRITIRLEASDADLLQPGARIQGGKASPMREVAAQAGIGAAGALDLPEASLRWMRAQGWLTVGEEDALVALRRFGVAEWTLAAGTSPEEAAGELLALAALRPVATERRDLVSLDEVTGLCARAMREADPATLPILALWCAKPGRIGVAEASHLDPVGVRGTAGEALIDYAFGPDRLLLLHRGCRFAPRPRSAGDRLAVMTASLLPEDRSRRMTIAPPVPEAGRAMAYAVQG